MRTLSLALVLAALGASSPGLAAPKAAPKPAPAAASAAAEPDPTVIPKMGTWGYDLSGRDPSVKAGADFYMHCNGSWHARTQIPADRADYGAFDVISDVAKARLRKLIESAVAGAKLPGASPGAAQIGASYEAYMDEKSIEKRGLAPLKPTLDAVRQAKDTAALAAVMGHSFAQFGASFFAAYVQQDAKAPDRYVAGIDQAGLHLPDRDYYLTAQFADKKAAYVKYVAKQLGAIGWPQAAVRATEIVDLETRIALVSWTETERRDPVKIWNPMTPAELMRIAPAFPWKPFLDAAGLGNATTLIVGEPTAITRIAEIFTLTPKETVQAWLAFSAVDNAAGVLPKKIDDAHFAFYGRTLEGQEVQLPRWKRGVGAVGHALRDVVAKLYVEVYFPAESKARMQALVKDLIGAMGQRIDRADWMSAATKAKAREKLSRLNVKVGYPDKWRDFSALVQKADDAFGNAERAAAFDWAFEIGRLSRPVDRSEWGMPPYVVNAYFDPTMNEIVFPAAILEAPFFDPSADAAINYGAIGGVIGHEITHGFDDQGRKFDAQGRLEDWWTPADAKAFTERAARLAGQYGALEVLPGAKVNGELTLGENIADLGGVLLALDAYALSLGGKPAPVIDGLTGEQRVLIGWAQVWRDKYRDDALRQLVASNPHSPPMLRVNAVMRNVDAWYGAFDVKAGDALFLAPADRVRVW